MTTFDASTATHLLQTVSPHGVVTSTSPSKASAVTAAILRMKFSDRALPR